MFVTLVSILTEVPKLAHETFKAIKPGLSAYADDPDQVDFPQHSPTPAEASPTVFAVLSLVSSMGLTAMTSL